MSHANFPRFLVGQNVPPPWGTNFETRDALEAMRAEAVRSHLAATAPVQARARAAALRRARKGGLASGALGGGLAVLAVWLVTASVIGNGAPATATASVSAPPAAAPAPAFPAGAQEGAQAVARSAPVAA
ncbi:hypothetical protein P3W85_26610, partial [Cupriavidus basilensis]|nr:hypothetical protein [Cupriavidus basilensis]